MSRSLVSASVACHSTTSPNIPCSHYQPSSDLAQGGEPESVEHPPLTRAGWVLGSSARARH
jgi:hypothetical protein